MGATIRILSPNIMEPEIAWRVTLEEVIPLLLSLILINGSGILSILLFLSVTWKARVKV